MCDFVGSDLVDAVVIVFEFLFICEVKKKLSLISLLLKHYD